MHAIKFTIDGNYCIIITFICALIVLHSRLKGYKLNKTRQRTHAERVQLYFIHLLRGHMSYVPYNSTKYLLVRHY